MAKGRNINVLGFPGNTDLVLTVHKSKGLEADDVILLNFHNSTLGFPNKIADDPVLAIVLAESEDLLNAEERRLLYVALTRTKNRVFILTDSRKPSEFFKEFKPSKSVFILNKETDIADLQCCRSATMWFGMLQS